LKKYAVFIFSFILLYMLLQISSGWVLTTLYTPDLSLTNNNLSQEAVFGQTSIIPMLATFAIAPLAYFFSQKLLKTTKK
jgi:hypothetical protein